MSVDVRAIRFHKTNGMTFLTSTCGTCVVGTGRRHRASRSRDNPCAAPSSLPHVRWKSDLFGAVLECSRAKCRLFPRRTDRDVELWTRQDRPRSSGSATWLSGEKAEPFFRRIVRRMVQFLWSEVILFFQV
jgi:hypothetical protein